MPFFFANTEGHGTWEVPAGVTTAAFSLWGGSMFSGPNGGVTIDDLTPGEIVHFNLGGNQISSGWNGGGASAGPGGFWSTGGGGATDVRRGGNALGDRVAVAGGAGGITATFLPFPGFAGNGAAPALWPGSYWWRTVTDPDSGFSFDEYTTPGFVDPLTGIPATETPVIGATAGPAAHSGSNGADAVAYSVTSHGVVYSSPGMPTGGNFSGTVYLGAGGGGWVGGDGGDMNFRQADPLFNPTFLNYPPALMRIGRTGTSWNDPSYAPGGMFYDNRPDYTDSFYGQRLLPGAIIIIWEVVAPSGWRIGGLGTQWRVTP